MKLVKIKFKNNVSGFLIYDGFNFYFFPSHNFQILKMLKIEFYNNQSKNNNIIINLINTIYIKYKNCQLLNLTFKNYIKYYKFGLIYFKLI